MAFVSSPSSTNEVNTANVQVSTANSPVSTADSPDSTANLSDATVYAFLANQPNGSQLLLLSMRARRLFPGGTVRRFNINGSDTVGYDISKVECFNCHKMGHFARECKGPKNQENRNRNQDNSRRIVNVEETSSKAMVAIDGAGFDWSFIADEESRVNKSEFNLATYKSGLAFVEEQLVFYKKNEILFCDQIVVLKRDTSFKDSEINALKSEIEKLKKEKESNQIKIDKFENASKSLDKLIGSQISDNSRKGIGFVSYNAVPPPPTRLICTPTIDLSNSSLVEFRILIGFDMNTEKGAVGCLVYVDDIIFGSTNKELCTEFEKLMHDKFQMSSMGELNFFLGLQVKQREDGIFISQDKYVAEILRKFGFTDVRTASTPMDTEKPLLKDSDGDDVDVHLYRSMIGSLMYLTSSRPDIMFAVCACARFQVTPKVSHSHAVKRIFRYLKGQPKLGLWYPRNSPFDLVAYSDSDYAGASLDRKSTTGGCQFLGCRLISWQCKKQTVVATSSTEAEYVAAASCCGQVLWIQNQMLDYGYNFMHTMINIDNNSTICIVKNPVSHTKTKHIEIRYHFIRDCYDKKLIQVIKIHTDHNFADLLTKALDVGRISTSRMDGRTCNIKQKCVMNQTPRQLKRGRDTKIPQSSGPLEKVGDEAVHKELGDRMERAATTTSSLEAEQDSSNINRT
ncbi:putative ribonuclease H-like domain-containing protein [Tanacetum coccineum]